MPVMVRVGNSGEFGFSTDQDAEAAKALVQNCIAAVKNEADEALAAKDAEVTAAHAEGAQHLSKFEEIKAKMAELQTLVDKVTSEEYQEGKATQLMAAKDEEQAIMGQPTLPEKDKLTAAVGNCKTVAERKAVIVAHVCNARGIAGADKFTPEQVGTAWSMLAAEAKAVPAPARETELPRIPSTRVQNAGGERKHPILQR